MTIYIYLCLAHKRHALSSFMAGFKNLLVEETISIHDDTATGGKCEAEGCYQDPGFRIKLTI